MEWVETTGRTVEEAKELALDQLGVHGDDAEFEVLEEPRAGLFGRVRGEARVRARVAPMQPRAKAERGSRRPKGTAAPKAEAPVAPVATEAESPVEAAPPDVAPKPPRAPRAPRDPAAPAREARPPREPRPPREAREGDEIADPEVEAARAVEFLDGLAVAFGAKGTASTTRSAEGDIDARLDGEDLGSLIGPRGQTIQAVQELTRLVAQRSGRSGRLFVDVGGYRERRKEALIRFTQQVSASVTESGQRRMLEPMGAPDRKIVHDAVQDIDGVASRSEGEDPYRCVVIEPA